MDELDGFMRRIKKFDEFTGVLVFLGPYHKDVLFFSMVPYHTTCNVPCKDTLYYQHKKSNNRTVFVTTYNPSLPNFNNIIKNIILFLPPLIAAKTPLKIHPFLSTATLTTFALPSYMLKLKYPKLHLLLHLK